MLAYFSTLFRQFLRSPSSLIIFILPILLLLGLGLLLPAAHIIPSTITIALTVAVLFVFGSNIFELRRTSIIKAMALTRLTKFSIFFTNIIFTVTIALLAWGFTIGLSYILTDVVDFLASDFSGLDPALEIISATVNWNQVDWLNMAYSVFITIAVAFALSYLFVLVVKSIQGLYMVVFIYVFALILMGGVVIPAFLNTSSDSWTQYISYVIPHYFTNNFMVSTFSTSGLTPEGINNLIDFLESIIDNTSDDIKADVDILMKWIDQGMIWQDVGGFINRIEIEVDGSYLSATNFQSEEVSNLFFGVLGNGGQFTLFNVSQENEDGFISFVKLLHQLLVDPETSEVLIPLLREYFKVGVTWDFTSTESLVNAMVPIGFVTLSSLVSVRYFKWSQR